MIGHEEDGEGDAALRSCAAGDVWVDTKPRKKNRTGEELRASALNLYFRETTLLSCSMFHAHEQSGDGPNFSNTRLALPKESAWAKKRREIKICASCN